MYMRQLASMRFSKTSILSVTSKSVEISSISKGILDLLAQRSSWFRTTNNCSTIFDRWEREWHSEKCTKPLWALNLTLHACGRTEKAPAKYDRANIHQTENTTKTHQEFVLKKHTNVIIIFNRCNQLSPDVLSLHSAFTTNFSHISGKHATAPNHVLGVSLWSSVSRHDATRGQTF